MRLLLVVILFVLTVTIELLMSRLLFVVARPWSVVGVRVSSVVVPEGLVSVISVYDVKDGQ